MAELRRGDNLAENCTDTLSLQNGQPASGSLKLPEQRAFQETEHLSLIRLFVISFKSQIVKILGEKWYWQQILVYGYCFLKVLFSSMLRTVFHCIITQPLHNIICLFLPGFYDIG